MTSQSSASPFGWEKSLHMGSRVMPTCLHICRHPQPIPHPSSHGPIHKFHIPILMAVTYIQTRAYFLIYKCTCISNYIYTYMSACIYICTCITSCTYIHMQTHASLIETHTVRHSSLSVHKHMYMISMFLEFLISIFPEFPYFGNVEILEMWKS